MSAPTFPNYRIHRRLTSVLLFSLEELGDLVTNVAIGHADVVLLLALVIDEVEETIIGDINLRTQIRLESVILGGGDTYELVLSALDNGDVHVVGRRAEILELLAGEDIDGDKVNLGVTVLAGLGGRHVDDLARAALDHDVTVLAQSRALHGEGGRGTGIGRIEGVLMLNEKALASLTSMKRIDGRQEGLMGEPQRGRIADRWRWRISRSRGACAMMDCGVGFFRPSAQQHPRGLCVKRRLLTSLSAILSVLANDTGQAEKRKKERKLW